MICRIKMSHYRLSLLILLSKYVFAASIEAEERSENAANYSQQNVYTPSRYTINLNLTADVFTENSDTFAGLATIILQFSNTTNEVSLHVDHSFIKIRSVDFNNYQLDTKDYAIDIASNLLNINVTAIPIAVGYNNRLIISYFSRYSTEDIYGFYKISYEDNDGFTKYLAATQFEPTYARRVFPCFDEPDAKAEFELVLTFPKEMNALFNTETIDSSTDPVTSLTTIQFDKTPKMSTYLFAIVVSEFTCTSGLSIDNITQFQVCSRNESAASRNLAVEIGPKIVDWLNNYTNYSYSKMTTKMDQVAIPDFAADAMENWGLVTYRESALLWDEEECSVKNKQSIATTMARELAHQWFGNLVTMKWWSELFLSEGFARYFEYHALDEIYPEWELDKQFLLDVVHPALSYDELENAQTLQAECSTSTEITAKFGVSSYSKGASILHMLKHMMGENNFKLGLQDYIQSYKLNNTESTNLWEILDKRVDTKSKFPANLTTIMKNWTMLSGFPLLYVEVSGHNITVTQEIFLSSSTNSPSRWYVPISYTEATSELKFTDTSPTHWLTPSEISTNITLDHNYRWVILNNQATGYYRVNYANILWAKIKEGLHKNNFDGISEKNRAQIVSDLFYLAKGGLQKYSTIFDILGFLAHDVSTYSWLAAFDGFGYLLNRVGANSMLGQAISNNTMELMRKIYESTPISIVNDSDHAYTLKQSLVLEWACKWGQEQCVKEVRTEFTSYRITSDRPDKNLKSLIYCYGLRYSDDVVNDWNFLWSEYTNTGLATEKLNILRALACTNELSLLNDLLSLSITASDIKSQDAASVFTFVYENPVGVDIALEFLTNNYAKIGEKYQSMGALGNLIKGIAEYLTNDSQIVKLRLFLQLGGLPDDFKVAANEALEIAEKNADWLTKFKKDLEDFYGVPDDSAATLPTISIIFVLFTVVFSKLLI